MWRTRIAVICSNSRIAVMWHASHMYLCKTRQFRCDYKALSWLLHAMPSLYEAVLCSAWLVCAMIHKHDYFVALEEVWTKLYLVCISCFNFYYFHFFFFFEWLFIYYSIALALFVLSVPSDTNLCDSIQCHMEVEKRLSV